VPALPVVMLSAKADPAANSATLSTSVLVIMDFFIRTLLIEITNLKLATTLVF